MTDDTVPGKDAETGPPKAATPAGAPAPQARVEGSKVEPTRTGPTKMEPPKVASAASKPKVEPVSPAETADAVEPASSSRGAARFASILAVIGIVAAGGTAFFAWQVSQKQGVSPSYSALEQRLAGLEVQLAAAREAAAARPVTSTPTAPVRNEALEARLAAIEGARNELATKLEALLGQIGRTAQQAGETRTAAATVETNHHLETIASDLAALKTRLDGMRGEIAGPIEARLAPIEQRLGPIETKLSALEARPAPVLPDPQALFQIALDDLTTRVEAGRPFTAAWRAVLAFSRDESAVKPAGTGWIDRSEAGIPTTEALAARFAERAAAVQGAETEGENWMDRALDRASRLVSIRRVDADMPGSTPEAITARVQGKLERGDAAGALADAEQLPAPSKARLGAWMADARARVAAETALSGLAQHAVPSTNSSAAKP